MRDTTSRGLTFLDVHYGAAAADVYRPGVRGGFDYIPAKAMRGRFAHVPSDSTCAACHEAHTKQVAACGCTGCHRNVGAIRGICTRQNSIGDAANALGIHADFFACASDVFRLRSIRRCVIGWRVEHAESAGQVKRLFLDAMTKHTGPSCQIALHSARQTRQFPKAVWIDPSANKKATRA